MTSDKSEFENRAVQRAEGNRQVLCERCDEPFVFGMKDKYHEFSIGLTTILECLVIAEQEGCVPSFPDEWWISLCRDYPFLAEVRENLIQRE